MDNVKLISALLFASLVLCGCDAKDTEIKPIKQISWQEAAEFGEFVLVSKKEECPYPYYTTFRTAYIKKDGQIYYISSRSCIPEEIWNDYFKDAQKGDTVRF